MTSVPSAPTVDSSKAPINEPITLTSATTQQIPTHLAPASLRVSITSFALGILFGTTLYLSLYLFSLPSLESAASNGWNLLGNGDDQEVTGNGFISNLVGLVNQGEVDKDSHWAWKPFEKPQFNFYLLSWAAFHMLEFVITARYNPTRLHVDSFLLQNGISYHLAHLLGITEFILETYFYPQIKNLTYFTYIGVVILLIGQFIRSLAMIHASGNFSHTVAWKKRGDHELVTDGIYSLTRHPSYLGFFYWALSTQILLSNPISFFVFIIVLWRFFNHRIRVEEEYLVEFFGKDYLDYRRRVGTLLPFIK